MKLQEFSYNDITLKYAYQAKQATKKALLVILTNCMETNGHIDFLMALSQYKSVPKLFLASARDYQFGLYLMKDKTYILRDAVESLIEKHRIEIGADKKDVYLIGYCAASFSAVNIAINQGYNCIFTEFTYHGSIAWSWDDNDPRKADFIADWRKESEHNLDLTREEYIESVEKYTGRTDPHNITPESFEYVRDNEPEKFLIPKFYFYAGAHEETWLLSGEFTCEKFRQYGINYELTLDDADFGHLAGISFFIVYLTATIERLGLV